MSTERPPRLRLFDILDCILQIEMAISGLSRDELQRDTLRYRAIERLLEIISEASRHIDDALKAQAPEVDWRQIANFAMSCATGPRRSLAGRRTKR